MVKKISCHYRGVHLKKHLFIVIAQQYYTSFLLVDSSSLEAFLFPGFFAAEKTRLTFSPMYSVHVY